MSASAADTHQQPWDRIGIVSVLRVTSIFFKCYPEQCMSPSPPLVIGALLAVVLGVPFGLYALLTRAERRTTREIRLGASERGWRCRRRRWQGNPTALRIDGRTGSGITWVLTSSSAAGNARGWAAKLAVRFPSLAGEVDFALLPRGTTTQGSEVFAPGLSANVESRVAAFSGTLASAAHFFRNARELPSGLPAFDERYQMLGLPEQFQKSFVDAAFADRFLHWSTDAVAPHSVLAWRDPFGLHVEARLVAPANWRAVAYFTALTEDFCARMPAPVPSPFTPRFVDRLVARFIGPS
jgi:hypothetical protein